MISLLLILEPLLLITALSIDPFISGYVCGSNKIKIPFLSAIVISLISSFILVLSLLLGATVKLFLPEPLTTAVCFLLLLGLGMGKMFDRALKALIQSSSSLQRDVFLAPFSVGFFALIYAKPEQADLAHSGDLSPLEASYLGLALSLDEFIAGVSTGIGNLSPLLLAAFAFLSSLLAIKLSSYLGNKKAQNQPLDLCLISGTLFIILAIMKLP